jgi:hypothetical protein
MCIALWALDCQEYSVWVESSIIGQPLLRTCDWPLLLPQNPLPVSNRDKFLSRPTPWQDAHFHNFEKDETGSVSYRVATRRQAGPAKLHSCTLTLPGTIKLGSRHWHVDIHDRTNRFLQRFVRKNRLKWPSNMRQEWTGMSRCNSAWHCQNAWSRVYLQPEYFFTSASENFTSGLSVMDRLMGTLPDLVE